MPKQVKEPLLISFTQTHDVPGRRDQNAIPDEADFMTHLRALKWSDCKPQNGLMKDLITYCKLH
jgi:hypothetical protein